MAKSIGKTSHEALEQALKRLDELRSELDVALERRDSELTQKLLDQIRTVTASVDEILAKGNLDVGQ